MSDEFSVIYAVRSDELDSSLPTIPSIPNLFWNEGNGGGWGVQFESEDTESELSAEVVNLLSSVGELRGWPFGGVHIMRIAYYACRPEITVRLKPDAIALLNEFGCKVEISVYQTSEE